MSHADTGGPRSPEALGTVRAVLFDLDDTLFDHRRSARQAVLCLRELSPALAAAPFEQVERTNRAILDEVHDQVLAGTIDPDEARVLRMARVFAAFGDPISAARAGEIADAYRLAYCTDWRAVPGAGDLLRALRACHLRLGVVTNNLVSEQVQKMERLGFSPLVDALVVSEEVGSIKPDPRIFHVALERLGTRREDAVMVGDAWQADIVGAGRAGIAAVWLDRQGQGVPDPAVPLAARLAALEPVEEVAEKLVDLLTRRRDDHGANRA